MKLDNEETMNQIYDDAEAEKMAATTLFQANMTTAIELGLKSKAELQLTKNKLTDVESEIEKLKRQS